MKSIYTTFIKNRFPSLSSEVDSLISEMLLSPYQVTLPNEVLKKAQFIVKQIYKLREKESYQESVKSNSPLIAQFNPGNKSVFMSYDFHITDNGELKLIEINTNAAFLLMGHLFYLCKNQPIPVSDFSLNEIKENILEELKLNSKTLNKNPQIAIIDENPKSQRLYIEFLLYQQLFNEWGFETQICDPSECRIENNQLFVNQSKIDFIYNRTTDFYLESESMQGIKNIYKNSSITLSPNPHEYTLLADKRRLTEWSLDIDQKGAFSSLLNPIKENLLKTEIVNKENCELLWENRKKLFFKPLSSFGSKGSYRGSGISRTHYDQIISNNFLAQEFCPAKEENFEAFNTPSAKLKYDLRFYAYKDRIQSVIARIYQGQVTNLKTANGGFSLVKFN